MKVAIINDTHFGARNDNKVIAHHHTQFFRNVFWPTIQEREIKTIFHLGDLLDRRKYVNFQSLAMMRQEFFSNMPDDCEVYLSLGNHDTYFKNTNDLNGPELLLNQNDLNLKIITNEPIEVHGCLLVPWITIENYESCIEAINQSNAKTCMGHFEIQGFEMMKGQICDHGIDKDLFDRFHNVFSGHFHHPSEYGNIKYLGAPYEMNWSDYNGKRGFHIYDTETLELEFIQNPYTIFERIYYNDTDMTIESLESHLSKSVQNKYVKVIIKERNNPFIFDLYMDKLQELGAFDVKVIEDVYDMGELDEADLIDEAQDTGTILSAYIDSIETNLNKKVLKSFVNSLYKEALSL